MLAHNVDIVFYFNNKVILYAGTLYIRRRSQLLREKSTEDVSQQSSFVAKFTKLVS